MKGHVVQAWPGDGGTLTLRCSACRWSEEVWDRDCRVSEIMAQAARHELDPDAAPVEREWDWTLRKYKPNPAIPSRLDGQ